MINKALTIAILCVFALSALPFLTSVQATSQSIRKTTNGSFGGWVIKSPKDSAQHVVGYWKEPNITTTQDDGPLYIFVSLGSVYSATYEQYISPQAGLAIDNTEGTLAYIMFDEYHITSWTVNVNTGDELKALVYYQNGYINGLICDLTLSWCHTSKHYNPGVARNGAVWGIDYISLGGYLASFSTLYWGPGDQATINGKTGYIGQFQNIYTLHQVQLAGDGIVNASDLSYHGSFNQTCVGGSCA